jgi:hypothetical protein
MSEHPESLTQAHQLLRLAEALAREDEGFLQIAGPGAGDRRTNFYIKELRVRASRAFEHDYSEARICGNTGLRVDYYFPDEHTIVEIAFSLRNSASEFERDILKAVVAKESGCSVNRLIFLCKPGGEERHQAPASLAFIQWLRDKHGIAVGIHDIRELDDLNESEGGA